MPREAKSLSPGARWWIVVILNMVESGHAWPADSNYVRLAPMHRPGEDPLSPCSYRLISILPVLYRIWAKKHYGHLAPWLQRWIPDEMYSCMKGRGAAEAALCRSVIIEAALMRGKDVTGGASDIAKAYDLLVRELTYELAILAGMPSGMMTALYN